MRVSNLDHLNLSVHDFDETAAWYARVFGFEVVQDEVDERGVRWGVLRSNDAMLCIYEYPERKMVPPDDIAGGGAHVIRHFGLRVSDRAAWEKTVARENLSLRWGSPVTWPHSTAWYVTDPTGWEIEVVSWNENEISFG